MFCRQVAAMVSHALFSVHLFFFTNQNLENSLFVNVMEKSLRFLESDWTIRVGIPRLEYCALIGGIAAQIREEMESV